MNIVELPTTGAVVFIIAGLTFLMMGHGRSKKGE